MLVHFARYALTPSLWALGDDGRAAVGSALRTALEGSADAVHLYDAFGTRADADLLVWSADRAESPDAALGFFAALRDALKPFRRHVHLVDALWGFTRSSQYARGGSDRAIDPMTPRTRPYLVVYPFAKTHEWYRLEAEERRRMMSEHIRLGRSHERVHQLLLYSTGLQDHEFVVVYETDDLEDFSVLVAELRATEARGFTLVDAPVLVGFHRPAGAGGPWP
jgi:chlorite dismutase